MQWKTRRLWGEYEDDDRERERERERERKRESEEREKVREIWRKWSRNLLQVAIIRGSNYWRVVGSFRCFARTCAHFPKCVRAAHLEKMWVLAQYHRCDFHRAKHHIKMLTFVSVTREYARRKDSKAMKRGYIYGKFVRKTKCLKCWENLSGALDMRCFEIN